MDKYSGKAWSYFTKAKTDILKVTYNLVSKLIAAIWHPSSYNVTMQ